MLDLPPTPTAGGSEWTLSLCTVEMMWFLDLPSAFVWALRVNISQGSSNREVSDLFPRHEAMMS